MDNNDIDEHPLAASVRAERLTIKSAAAGAFVSETFVEA
jgi:hypothetical protein